LGWKINELRTRDGFEKERTERGVRVLTLSDDSPSKRGSKRPAGRCICT
jgi:hypothetical protein